MERAGAARVITDSELDPKLLLDVANGLFADEEALATMAAASRGLAMPDAARRIADEVLSAASERGASEQDHR
jgi:UDP-N-acetylglucosamine--N-acetylmuramyl-(pentapeptide) pyrophosphoryl-undecaprenol N-acetylglucosamine transferase